MSTEIRATFGCCLGMLLRKGWRWTYASHHVALPFIMENPDLCLAILTNEFDKSNISISNLCSAHVILPVKCSTQFYWANTWAWRGVLCHEAMLLHGQVRLAGERGFLFTTLEKIMYPLQILTMAKHSKLRYNQTNMVTYFKDDCIW